MFIFISTCTKLDTDEIFLTFKTSQKLKNPLMKAFSILLPALLIMVSIPESFSQQVPDDVMKVHQKAVVIDTHTDVSMMLAEKPIDLSVRHQAPESRVDFPRLKEGGVDAIFFGLFTAQRDRTPENYDAAYRLATRMIDSTLEAIHRNPELVALATSPEDIVKISGQGKTAICLGMENGFPLAKDLSRIKEFYDKGVRYITLCHTSNNDICDSSTDPNTENNGLSDFGRQVVAEMNRLGMLIDVSHLSDKSFQDVLAVSTYPVFASHSSTRALCNHPRNMSDDMIRALAAKGGVIQICLYSGYVKEEDTTSMNYKLHKELEATYHNWQFSSDSERDKAWQEYDSIDLKYPPVLATISEAVDHIDHVVKIAGIDYVGIGSDFDGGGGLADCRDVTDYPKITAELMKRGYSQEDIDKIWGGNFLRVWGKVKR
jgi:membrane dipeptidase